ncbi:hypothetical protein AJ80_00613 [Polytolypa hystricis UAMH7299]|uniref:ABC multidrug transporter MDR2 n=1 Tax=Polytolypa hystricis (strain UAMH7299) TaxID=1447883 RepID=A0A2B7Z2G3_POLH7|nr:hypothetical protein AJ80_00613 [Polytolypa hystricis UAMH7299]
MAPEPAAEPSSDAPAEKPDEAKRAPVKNFWLMKRLSRHQRILTYGTALDHFLMIAAAICAVGAGIALPLMNIVFGNLVSDFNGYFIPGSGVTKSQFLSGVNQNALYIVYIFIGKFVLGYVSMFSVRMSSIRISARLRLSYLRALFSQPISVLDTLPPGRSTTAITTSSNIIQAGISDKLAMLVQSLALVVGAYVIAFKYSWKLTLVSSSSIVFIILMYSALIPPYLAIYKKVQTADEKASSVASEALGTIRTIVSCGAENRVLKRYVSWNEQSRKKGLRLSPLVGLQLSPANFAMFCNFALTFWFGVKQYMSGNIPDAGTVIIVVFSILIVVSASSYIASPIMAISKAISESTVFFDMIDAPRLKTSGLKEPDVSPSEDITFENVTFSYPSRPNVKILDNLTLRIPAGKLTAIVGPSGCGKSTLVGLLERWYQIGTQVDESEDNPDTPKKEEEAAGEKPADSPEPIQNDGIIKIGSHNIEDLDLKWWRSQIGLVQQEPFSFNASIYTNVSYGLIGSKWENESEEVKRKLVKEACQEAFAAEYIDRLPQGYDTIIGENGIKLSGGQRQRLAIARSIIKRPPILILDEATSSIDVRGERIVQEALDRVSANRTTITIAHRLSTIRKADNIVVLKQGAAIEQGTHEELLLKEGLYHTLVNSQHLEMGEEDSDLQEVMTEASKQLTRTEDVPEGAVADTDEESGPSDQSGSLLGAVGLLLWEQRKHWILYMGIVIGAAGCGAAYALQSFIFGNLVQTFQLEGQRLMERAEFWALMFFILALGTAVFYLFLGWSSMSLSTHMCATYREQYFQAILAKPVAFYERDGNSGGSLTSRLSNDTRQLQELLGPTMALPAISVFNILGCIAVAFSFGWKLTLVSIFSAYPLLILAMFIRVRYEVQFEKLNAAVFESSSQFASEAIAAIRTVTALTLEDTITARYDTLLRDHVRKAFLKARFAVLIFAAADSIELPCMALCFWYGGQLLSTYEYSVLQFFVIYIAVVLGGQAAGQFGSVSPNLAQASAASNRILNIRNRDPEQNEGSGDPPKFEDGAKIEFKSVQFKYPTRDVTVFRNLSFTIEKGQFAALVGPSGCGKSTVIGMLERFYDYQSGSICVDGAELRTLNVAKYRQSLSLVSQEPNLYQGSMRDNILLGVDPTSVTDEDVEKACKDAEIHDFIMSLPEGYNTDAGIRGLALSGGQKQRICIARALIRNPGILLLDEATSSLDSESEKLVQAAFERTAKGRTVVVVAHRLATIQNADIIFVFGEGGIVENGDHHTLLKKRGTYYQMCQSQALDR